MKKMENFAIKKGLKAAIFGLFAFLLANPAQALTKWTAPPKPSGVPTSFDQAIMNLTSWILGFVAMIGVLALIWGGVNYLTSAGNEDQARSGKKVIQYAIIGLVIAGLAYALINVIVTIILV